MSKSIDAAGGSESGYLDLFLNSRSVVEQTRREWFERPEELLPADARIAVGIGFAALTRGGWVIYEEDDGSRPMTVADAERLALRAPEHEWCIHLVGTGQERHYKRVGAGTVEAVQVGCRSRRAGEPLRAAAADFFRGRGVAGPAN